MKSFSIEIGRLYCGQVREFLDSLIFTGKPIQYIESKGFLSRMFTIKGDDDVVYAVQQSFKRFADDVNSDDGADQ